MKNCEYEMFIIFKLTDQYYNHGLVRIETHRIYIRQIKAWSLHRKLNKAMNKKALLIVVASKEQTYSNISNLKFENQEQYSFSKFLENKVRCQSNYLIKHLAIFKKLIT